MRGRCNRTMRYITFRSLRLPDTPRKLNFFFLSYILRSCRQRTCCTTYLAKILWKKGDWIFQKWIKPISIGLAHSTDGNVMRANWRVLWDSIKTRLLASNSSIISCNQEIGFRLLPLSYRASARKEKFKHSHFKSICKILKKVYVGSDHTLKKKF